MLKQIPAHQRDNILAEIANLESIVTREGTEAFAAIIKQYGDDNIYALALYYAAGSWGYLMPTLATEKGLEYAAADYTKHSPLSLDQEKQSLRWSPCDSPYHGSSELDAMMPETATSLLELEALWSEAQAWLFDNESDDDAEDGLDRGYKLVAEIHDLIHASVIKALSDMANTSAVRAYKEKTHCVICLNAGDISQEDFLRDVKALNPESVYLSVQAELEQADQISKLEPELWEKKRNEEKKNPPTTKLILKDFEDIIENFSPSFKQLDDSIIIESDKEHFGYPGSAYECAFNRFNLMEILQASPHFEELDKLFGHFIGENFKKDDLLPQIGRALVIKLGELLSRSFPGRSFYTHLVVNRNELYRFAFVLNRQDGYTFDMKCASINEGVHELRRIGPLPATIKVPCGFLQDNGQYLVQIFGIEGNKLFTEKSLHKEILLAGSDTSFEDAKQAARDLILDHLNNGFNNSHLDINEIAYPDEFARIKIVTDTPPPSEARFSYIETWDEVEVSPDFLTHNLVEET